MRYAYFPGCKIPCHLPQYDRATRAVLDRVGVRIADNLPFNCCGDPLREWSLEAALLSAARNLALADARHLPILTPCKCCYGQLMHAEHWLSREPALEKAINRHLAREGLAWRRRDNRIFHLLTVLDRHVGPDALAARVIHPVQNLRVAVQYGCHALRPGHVMRFDNPLAPTIFERLLTLTGAAVVEWPLRLECCGNPLWEKDSALSLWLMNRKLTDARQAGADLICTACTHCQIQFDTVQAQVRRESGSGAEEVADQSAPAMPAVLYPQLLGLAMGLPGHLLGIGENRIPSRLAIRTRSR